MRIIKNIGIAIVTLSVSFGALFAAPKLPVVEILGKNYYVYEIKKGDSLFGISREYDWDYTELQKLNPNAIAPLQKGMKIYYPVTENDDHVYTPVVVPEETELTPVKHVVRRGETVYGISRMYKIPIETIYALNPSSREGIKENEILKLQTEVKEENDSNTPEYYTIKSGDTLYRLAKTYNTSVAAILKKNPGISEKNFRAGETIRLPERGTGIRKTIKTVEEERLASFSTYKVEKKDTWESIAEKTGVDKEELKEANKEFGDKPKNKALVSIPNIDTISVERVVIEEDPRELTAEGIAEIYEDVHGLSDSIQNGSVKVALVLSEPTSRKDLEFSRGFLAGIDRIKRGKIKIELSIIDGNRPSSEVLENLSEFEPDILFLTTEKGIPTYLSEYAEISQTPMVNTFDVKNELYTRNPYVIQLLTPSNYFNDEIASRVKSDYSDYTLVFVGEEESGDQLAAALKDDWNKVISLSIEDLSSFRMSESGKYLFYGNPSKKDQIESLLSGIIELRNTNPLSEIIVLGRPSWIVFDDTMEEQFHKCNVLLPSRFYYDKDSTEGRRFASAYTSLFDRTPAKSYPMYAGVGYDAAHYFIEGLAKSGRDMNMMGASRSGAQSDFDLYRPGNWTGFMNPTVFLVRFTPFNTIEKIVVK